MKGPGGLTTPAPNFLSPYEAVYDEVGKAKAYGPSNKGINHLHSESLLQLIAKERHQKEHRPNQE